MKDNCVVLMLAEKKRLPYCKQYKNCGNSFNCPGYDNCEGYERGYCDDYELILEDGTATIMSKEELAEYTISFESVDIELEMKSFRNILKVVGQAYSQWIREVIHFMSE